MPKKSINYNIIDEIDALKSIIKRKQNENFNNIIKALADDDFPAFSKSTNNLTELRLIEVRLAEIPHQWQKEVEEIAEQVDSL